MLGERDEAVLAAALRAGADLVALSFVRSAHDAAVVRRAMRAAIGTTVPLVAKIERAIALDHLDGIVAAFDGAMIARGDLGVEIDLADVPAAQKRIIATARRAATPVIVATEMLESMIGAPRPTRAEASDVVNAILDGASAVMLSGETSIGVHPIEATLTMAHLVVTAEAIGSAAPVHWEPADADDALVRAAVELAARTPGAVIGVITRTGSTARRVASLRPANRVVVLCAHGSHEAWSLLWGVESSGVDLGEDRSPETVRTTLASVFDIANDVPIVAISGHTPGRSEVIYRLDPRS